MGSHCAQNCHKLNYKANKPIHPDTTYSVWVAYTNSGTADSDWIIHTERAKPSLGLAVCIFLEIIKQPSSYAFHLDSKEAFASFFDRAFLFSMNFPTHSASDWRLSWQTKKILWGRINIHHEVIFFFWLCESNSRWTHTIPLFKSKSDHQVQTQIGCDTGMLPLSVCVSGESKQESSLSHNGAWISCNDMKCYFFESLLFAFWLRSSELNTQWTVYGSESSSKLWHNPVSWQPGTIQINNNNLCVML